MGVARALAPATSEHTQTVTLTTHMRLARPECVCGHGRPPRRPGWPAPWAVGGLANLLAVLWLLALALPLTLCGRNWKRSEFSALCVYFLHTLIFFFFSRCEQRLNLMAKDE